MSYELVWMPRAKITFHKNIEYLQKDWNNTVIIHFLEKVEKTLLKISDNPYLYPFYKTSKKVRRCIINRRIILFYRIAANNTIEILLFWSTYQNPKKLKY
jgi:plasmid stabilization system protein ParE